MGYWYTWGLFAPVITWLVRNNPLEGHERRRSIFRLATATLVIAPLQFVLASAIRIAGLYSLSVIDGEQLRTMAGIIPAQTLAASFDSAFTYWMIAGVVYAFLYYRRLQERELNASRLEASLTEARLMNLRAQIRPHFLFNTLNSISALVTENPVAAENMIARLSSLLRMAQDGDQKKTSSLETEMDFVRQYLEIEQTRFQDRLTIQVTLPKELSNIHIPPLLLQPLVENAVIHGIATMEAPGRITVEVRKTDDSIHLSVRDSGPGFSPDNPDGRVGIGLANTKDRLQQLYGDRAGLTFHRHTAEEFEARITIDLDCIG